MRSKTRKSIYEFPAKAYPHFSRSLSALLRNLAQTPEAASAELVWAAEAQAVKLPLWLRFLPHDHWRLYGALLFLTYLAAGIFAL